MPLTDLDPTKLSKSDRKAYDRATKAAGICPKGYVPGIILGEFSQKKGPKKCVKDSCKQCGKKRVNRMGPCLLCVKKSNTSKTNLSVIGNGACRPSPIQPTTFVRTSNSKSKSVLETFGTSDSPTERVCVVRENANNSLKNRIFDISSAEGYDSGDDFQTTSKSFGPIPGMRSQRSNVPVSDHVLSLIDLVQSTDGQPSTNEPTKNSTNIKCKCVSPKHRVAKSKSAVDVKQVQLAFKRMRRAATVVAKRMDKK